MVNIEEVEKYIERVFDLYHIDKEGFFYETSFDGKDFVDGRRIELSLFPFGIIEEKTLNRVSIALGLSKEEIISMDNDAAFRYWDKYPFFRLYSEYLDRIYWASNFSGEYLNPEERLVQAIFSDEDEPFGKRSYDHDDVIHRLLHTLKEADLLMPGTYHNNAFLRHIEIANSFFFSFPDCSAMIRSFLNMVSQLENLFFKSLDNELCEEEINEMNFLATWLWARDKYLPSYNITYDLVRKLRNVYKSEDENDFYYYVSIKNFIGTKPWQCKEFFQDMDLVQRFVNVFPQAKQMMRSFSMEVKHYSCVYEWSDAEPIVYSPEEEPDLYYFDKIMGFDQIPLEERPKQREHIYVPKVQNEMVGWEESLIKLKEATSPPRQGGLTVPKRYTLADDEQRMPKLIKRLNAKQGVADNV